MKPTHKLLTSLIGTLLLAAFGTASAALVIPTSFGDGADTVVRGGTNSGTNYGTLASLQTSLASVIDNNKRWVYLKFDVSAVTSTMWTEATSANLDMYRAFGTGILTARIYGLNDSENADGWDESTITANNAPGIDNPTTLTLDLTVLTDLGTLSFNNADFAANAAYPTFTNAALLNFLKTDTDGLVTFVVALETSSDSVNSNNFGIRSKEYSATGIPEGSLAPTLTIIPEPNIALLGGLGMLALLRRRR